MESHDLRPELPELPKSMRTLPVDKRGYPVPWFVHWPKGGEPEFRIMGRGKYERAVKDNLCWICGMPFTNRRKYFVVWPMCTINRISAEPPSHADCARFAAVACPFLSRPHMVRRENDLPEHQKTESGLLHNPGVTAVWFTRSYTVLVNADNSPLVRMGEPLEVWWYTEGRTATRSEVLAAISRGIPKLIESCQGDMAALLSAGEKTAWVLGNIVPRRLDDSPECPFPALAGSQDAPGDFLRGLGPLFQPTPRNGS